MLLGAGGDDPAHSEASGEFAFLSVLGRWGVGSFNLHQQRTIIQDPSTAYQLEEAS